VFAGELGERNSMVAPAGLVGAATVTRRERDGGRRSQPGGRGRAGRSRRVPRGNGRAAYAATFVRLDGSRRKRVALAFGPARGTTRSLARKFVCVTKPTAIRARQNIWSGGTGCHCDLIHRLGWPSGIHQRRAHENNETNLETFAGRVRVGGKDRIGRHRDTRNRPGSSTRV